MALSRTSLHEEVVSMGDFSIRSHKSTISKTFLGQHYQVSGNPIICFLFYVKYLNNFLLTFHDQGDVMEDKNTTTDANIVKSRSHKNLHSNSET